MHRELLFAALFFGESVLLFLAPIADRGSLGSFVFRSINCISMKNESTSRFKLDGTRIRGRSMMATISCVWLAL